MAIELNVSQLQTDQTNASLDSLAQAKGTLYVKNGVIQESKHPLGRAFLGLFSKTIRQENKAALDAVQSAVERVIETIWSVVRSHLR